METPRNETRRGRLGRYAFELAVSTLAGLALFLVLLLMLQLIFPDATGLGELVRTRNTSTPSTHARPAAASAADVPTTVAVLSEVRREVREKSSSSVVWTAARRGAELGDGDAVQSYEASSATLRFDPHNKLELGEKSLVVLRASRADGGTTDPPASVLFMEGFLRGRLAPAGGRSTPVQVIAGGGTIRPRGPDGARVEIDMAVEQGASTLAVRSGDAEVVWGGRATVVPAGHLVTYDSGQSPGRPVPLPGAPIPVSPADGAAFRYRGSPPRVSFVWRPVDQTEDFSLEVAHDQTFETLVFARRQATTEFTHGALAPGTYYWRAVGRRGPIRGAPGTPARFTVEATKAGPALRVDLPGDRVPGLTIVVQGQTDPGCRVIVGGAPVPTDPSGAFAHTLELREGYNFIVVQAVDSVGNTTFDSRRILAGSTESARTP